MGLMAAQSDQKGFFWKAATPSLGTYNVICALFNTNKPMTFDGSVWNKIISFRFLQPENIQSPTHVTELGMVMLVSAVHPLNAYSPIHITELGMVMLVRAVHPLNASFPIFVTDSGMLMLVSAEHPLNA